MKPLLLIAVLLTACTTPAERRMQRPELDLTSPKPSRDVAVCIADKWENTKQFMGFSSDPVNTGMKPNGYSVSVTGSNLYRNHTTLTLADVTDRQPSGSATKYYKAYGGGFGDYDEVVKQCQ